MERPLRNHPGECRSRPPPDLSPPGPSVEDKQSTPPHLPDGSPQPSGSGHRSPWRLDHLVYACRDLDRAVSAAEETLGVRSVPGGRHPGKGTMNALIGLGPDMYLEIVGADPEQPVPEGGRWFQVDRLETPRLVTWCAAGGALAEIHESARQAGIDLGAISAGGRRRPDGSELRWGVTDPGAHREGGVIPFFIDWQDSRHPALDLPGGGQMVELRGGHPRGEEVSRLLEALGLPLPLEAAPEPFLVALIRTRGGVVELR